MMTCALSRHLCGKERVGRSSFFPAFEEAEERRPATKDGDEEDLVAVFKIG
jgi:hypothetical protein